MAKMLLSEFHRRYDAIQAEYSGRTLSHREALERRCRCEDLRRELHKRGRIDDFYGQPAQAEASTRARSMHGFA